jgi:hypothetical protein
LTQNTIFKTGSLMSNGTPNSVALSVQTMRFTARQTRSHNSKQYAGSFNPN